MGFDQDLLEASQSCRDPASFAAWRLERLQSMVGYDSAILVSSTSGAMLGQVNKQPYVHLLRRMSRDLPRYAAGFEKGRLAMLRDGAYLDTEVYSARERRSMPFYLDVVRPQGIKAQICATTTFRGRAQSVTYLCRHGRGSFRRAELEGLRRVLPLIGLAEAALGAHRVLETTLDLTMRELQIAGYVCRGLRNQDIAEVLGTSPNTVRNQIQRLFEKSRVSNRAELVAVFLRTHTDQ